LHEHGHSRSATLLLLLLRTNAAWRRLQQMNQTFTSATALNSHMSVGMMVQPNHSTLCTSICVTSEIIRDSL
jgi:hypothetical protein